MIDGYDKPLHSPPQYKTMESPAQELDEVALDATIADLLNSDEHADKKVVVKRSEFPDLKSQETIAVEKDARADATLRTKWAQLSGAA